MKMIFFSKPLVPDAGTINPDLIMYERFKTDVTVGSPDATFKVIHLWGYTVPVLSMKTLNRVNSLPIVPDMNLPQKQLFNH